jgi:histidine triad (HIT) family protein
VVTYDDNNVFALILRGELPAHNVFEDNKCLAFMDLMPQSPGHTLVIPRAPAVDLFDLPAEDLAHTMAVTQRVAHAVKTAFDAPGLMLAQLSGPEAGQTVFHVHFHIVPRWEGLQLKFHAREPEDPSVLAEHAQRIRDAL